MAKKNNQKKENALDLFLNTDKTQKEIAAILDVSEKTISAWAEEGYWDTLKGASTITPAKIVAKLYKKLEDLTDADRLDTDALIKTARTIEALSDRRVTLSQTINVFKDFNSWLYSRDGEFAKIVNEKQMEYINQMGSKE